MLGQLERGSGRVRAARVAGTSYSTLKRELREDTGFREAVAEASRQAAGRSSERLVELVESEDGHLALKAAVAYLARQDKIDESLRARAERKAALEAKGSAASPEAVAFVVNRVVAVLAEFVPADLLGRALARLEQAVAGPERTG